MILMTQNNFDRYEAEKRKQESKNSPYLAVGFIIFIGFLSLLAGVIFKLIGV